MPHAHTEPAGLICGNRQDEPGETKQPPNKGECAERKTDLEVERDEREDKGAEVLREDVELEEAVGVAALLDVEHAPDLARHKRDVRVVAHNLELLLPVLVGHRPLGIVRPVRGCNKEKQ